MIEMEAGMLSFDEFHPTYKGSNEHRGSNGFILCDKEFSCARHDISIV